MAYIDATFFNAYSGYTVPDTELMKLIDRAGDMIDALTMDKIGGDTGFALFTADIQTRIKKAVAAQVEMLFVQGGFDALTEVSSGMVTLGKFNYGKGNGGGSDTRMLNGVPIAPLVLPYLRPTGLLFRGLRRVIPRIPLENRISLYDDDQY